MEFFLTAKYSLICFKLYYCQVEAFRNQQLTHKVHNAQKLPITTELQTSTRMNISTEAVHQELHGTGFHGPVAVMCGVSFPLAHPTNTLNKYDSNSDYRQIKTYVPLPLL